MMSWGVAMLVGLLIGGGLGLGLGAALRRFHDHAYFAGRRGRQSAHEERLAELSEVTGGLAHEIRNPLSTVRMNLGLLSEDWREADANDADLRRRSLTRLEGLRREAERLGHILDDFLRLVGKHDLDLQRVDLNELVKRVVEFTWPQADPSGVTMRLSLSSDPVWCDLDVNLFEQALLNIVLNAQQAMEDSGGEMIVRTEAAGDRVGLEIADTGPGMSPEILSRIFHAYYSTKTKGTGLGLSITRRIVSEHGGTIEASSEPGRGTCFTIQLPRAS